MKAKSVKMFAIKIWCVHLVLSVCPSFSVVVFPLNFYFIDLTYNLISHHSLSSQNIDKIASDSDLLLGEKTLRTCAPDSDSFLANFLADSGGNHWDALRASHIWTSEKPPKKSLSLILVYLLYQARTYFQSRSD